MEWFELYNDSIASLAEFSLCLCLIIYLVSVRRKSQDGWLVLGLFIAFASLFVVSFLHNSFRPAPFFNRLESFHFAVVSGFIIYKLFFAYTYRQNLFPSERLKMVILASVIAILGVLFDKHIVNAILPTYLYTFLSFWITGIYIRKFLKATAAGYPDQQKSFFKAFQSPKNADAKAYRDFTLWNLVENIIWVNISLGVLGAVPFWWVLHHQLFLFSLVWLVVIYANNARERTTFLAKLVGLFLCMTMMLLGALPFLLYGPWRPAAEENHILVIFAVLVPATTVIIAVILPVFLRSNLLRPLNHVLKGVQKVNSGNLQLSVPVLIQDEIGDLAENFNQMTLSLRQSKDELTRYAETLELQVAERTSDLVLQRDNLKKALKDLKIAQEQLIQREKMASLGELTAGVAHEIKNPLNFVNNFSEVSQELIEELRSEKKRAVPDPILEENLLEDLENNLQKINHHGRRADAIIKNMLQHSRTSAGEKQLTELNALTEEYLRMAYYGMRTKDKSFFCILDTCYDPALEKVEVVPQELGRVLLNFFNNAFYSVQQKQKKDLKGYSPKVTVNVQRKEEQVEIQVRDNGIGIPESVKSKIFQPFFTTKPTGQGTGLGLSLSYDIITKVHGGEVAVNSIEGDYTEFILLLPYVPVERIEPVFV